MTQYMKHSLLGTWWVISSIITRNFFVTRNKQPMTIGTNRMCISRDDIAPTPCAFHDSSRQLQENSSTCVIRVILSVSYLFSFLLCDEFLKTCFLSMPQLSKYVSIRSNERFRKSLQSGRYLAPTESPCCN